MNSPENEELTEAMHSEFSVASDQEKANLIQTAKTAVRVKMMTAEEAAEIYGLTLAEIQ